MSFIKSALLAENCHAFSPRMHPRYYGNGLYSSMQSLAGHTVHIVWLAIPIPSAF